MPCPGLACSRHATWLASSCTGQSVQIRLAKETQKSERKETCPPAAALESCCKLETLEEVNLTHLQPFSDQT